MKNKLKSGMYLIDDCNLTYKVIEVFTNSAIVLAVSKIEGNFACEIMTFEAMENENWKILKIV